ncbi:MAG: asparagine synthase (glutamine-hydrolyzing) [Microthrixaceae bacterium]
MCGIVGLLTATALNDDDLREVDRLGELMARRGPDDEGTWTDGRHFAAAFRRLSIIDLTQAGHQPMVSTDGRHVVTFNGEIYNFRELRRELTALDHRFRSTSDTEVALVALQEWGEDAFARFNGMFAIAWYRPETRRLVLARDPVGIKPLHYWWSHEAVVYGSQYDQVVRHRRCRRDLVDDGALAIYLRLGYLPPPWGIIADTHQVEAGTMVTVEPGGTPSVRTFRAPAGTEAGEGRLPMAATDETVAAAVAEAVERQMVSDVEVGCFLSGGVDSPLVAAEMRSHTTATVKAFTIGTEDPASDESVPAARYAALLDLEQHSRRISGEDAFALIDDVASAYQEPFGDYSSFPTLMVSHLAAEQVKVVLSGDGGDELFWGYPRFDKVRRARRWFSLPRAARFAAYAASKPLPTSRRPARGVLFPTVGDWYLDAHSGLRQPELGRIAPGAATLPDAYDHFRRERTGTEDELMQWMRRNELECHLQMILTKVDRAAMFHSLEVRVPLLDMEVVDLSARVDPQSCLASGVGKQVLRRALEAHVPREDIPRPKKGFTVPLGSWLRNDLRPVVQELLLDDEPFPSGALDRRAIGALYEAHRSGGRDHTRGLWNLLSLQLWARRHLRPLGSRP